MQQRQSDFEEREETLGLVGDERAGDFSRPRRRLPATLLTVLVMALFAGGLWFAYVQGARHSGAGGPGDGVPLIRADERPTKIKPEQPGGMPIPDQNISLYNEKPGGKPVEKLLPPPEQPMPRPAAPPSGAAAPAPAAPPSSIVPGAGSPQSAASTPSAAATSPAGAPAQQKQQQAAVAPPAKAAAKSAAQPKPAALTNAPAAASPPAAAKAGPVRVQLGALRSPDAARDEWARLKREHPDLLGKLTAVAVRVDLGDKGIFYRIQTQPFADPAAADRLCAELKRRKLGCALAR